MMDFILQSQDIEIVDGDLAVCATETDCIAQTIAIRLKTLAGEWFLDENLGIPYFTEIYGQKRNARFIRQVIAPEIQAVPGISHIKDFRIEEIGRSLHVNFIAIASDGSPVEIKESIGI